MAAMAKPKPIWLFVLLGIIVLVTAGTLYVNRVILPVQIKNTITAQAKNFLKRDVTIGSLRFSWVRGLILDDVAVSQKDSPDVFFKSKRVSLGIIFIPGFKEHRLTIPSVDIVEPYVHVTRTGPSQWNFSDLLTVPAGSGSSPSNINVSVLGVNITAGHIVIDDITTASPKHQELNDLNLKVGLGIKGIDIDARAALNNNAGSFALKGSYQPLTKAIDAHVSLNNIRPVQYLSFLPPLPGVTLADALINTMNIDGHYDEDFISVKGAVNAADLNVTYGTMHFAGNVEADINQCDIRKNSVNIDASVTARDAALLLSPQQTFKGTISLEKARIRQDKDGTQFVGTINGQNMDIAFDGQTVHGNVLARPLTVEMPDVNNIDLKGDVRSNHIDWTSPSGQSLSGKISLNDAHLVLTNGKDAVFEGKAALDEMELVPAPNVHASGSIDLKALSVNLKEDVLTVKTKGELNNWQVNLDKDKNIIAESSFSVDAAYPLKKPADLKYTGTFTVDHADVTGYPLGPYNNITAKGDFKTDQISIKLFSFLALQSSFKGAATVLNFKDPVLSVDVTNEELDLAKVKDIVPDIYAQYGLTTTGTASFNATFEGLLSSALSGKIGIKAKLNNVSVSSSTFAQQATGISGNVEGTLDSLAWKDFKGTYLGKQYTLSGSLKDFKSPRITTTIDGDDIKLSASIENKGKSWAVNTFTGKYFDVAFNTTGSVSLPSGQSPLVDLQTSLKFNIEKILPLLPPDQQTLLQPYGLAGAVSIDGHVGGSINDWKNLASNAVIKSPGITVMGYHVNDIAIDLNQHDGRLSNVTLDALAYNGKIHNVLNMDLIDKAMPFDIAANLDGIDLQLLKKDIPALNGKEIKGKFYLTTVGKGTVADIKNISAKGSLAIREGFLTEFKFFEGLLGILNEAMKLGQLTITDVEGNFTVENAKITTDNLRLLSPTIVLLTQGWVGMDQMCDLHVGVDMTSGVIPPIAEQVLRSLDIHIYDKISAPKFNKKISVPQVINSIIKTIGIFQ